eukprot:jgi/Hompol1/1325/HPOL_005561-RA
MMRQWKQKAGASIAAENEDGVLIDGVDWRSMLLFIAGLQRLGLHQQASIHLRCFLETYQLIDPTDPTSRSDVAGAVALLVKQHLWLVLDAAYRDRNLKACFDAYDEFRSVLHSLDLQNANESAAFALVVGHGQLLPALQVLQPQRSWVALFGKLVTAAFRCNDDALAKNLLNDMVALRINVGGRAASWIIDGFAKSRRLDQAEAWICEFAELQMRTIPDSASVRSDAYNTNLDNIMTADESLSEDNIDDGAEGQTLYQECCAMHNRLLRRYLTDNNTAAARDWFRKSASLGFVDSRTFAIMLHQLIVQNNLSGALALYKDWQRLNFSASPGHYVVFVQMFSKLGWIDHARSIITYMLEQRQALSKSDPSYSYMHEKWTRAIQQAYNWVITKLCDLRLFSQINSTLIEMQSHDIVADEQTIRPILTFFIDQKSVTRCKDLLSWFLQDPARLSVVKPPPLPSSVAPSDDFHEHQTARFIRSQLSRSDSSELSAKDYITRNNYIATEILKRGSRENKDIALIGLVRIMYGGYFRLRSPYSQHIAKLAEEKLRQNLSKRLRYDPAISSLKVELIRELKQKSINQQHTPPHEAFNGPITSISSEKEDNTGTSTLSDDKLIGRQFVQEFRTSCPLVPYPIAASAVISFHAHAQIKLKAKPKPSKLSDAYLVHPDPWYHYREAETMFLEFQSNDSGPLDLLSIHILADMYRAVGHHEKAAAVMVAFDQRADEVMNSPRLGSLTLTDSSLDTIFGLKVS